ncbi:MAG: long-chain-fatty-acid-CoA ligase [Acidimicrobiales bacterium]|nr:long-chain-fatty-acid-CoA ligase [Acidimicrobiales bacterium]
MLRPSPPTEPRICDALDRASTVHGGAPALVDVDGRVRTWAKVRTDVARLSRLLVALGVRRGDRVAVASANRSEYLELFFACSRLGAILVPLNTRLTGADLADLLDRSQPTVLAVDAAHEDLAAAVGGSAAVLSLDRGGRGTPIGCRHRLPPAPAAPVDGDTPVALMFTGGTTGEPKGVTLTHRNLVHNSEQVSLAFRPTADDRYLHAAPMFHIGAWALAGATTAAGGCHAFVARFDADLVLAAIATGGVTTTLLVPTMLRSLLRAPGFDQLDLSGWRLLVYGGAPVDEPLQREALERLPCSVAQCYGMTELSPFATVLTDADHRSAVAGGRGATRLNSVGRALPGVRVQVVDARGGRCAPGEAGEVCVAGANVMSGYWDDPAATAETVVDGWLYTGDVGYLDEDGYLFLLDRSKDVVITGGENVYSIEVEAALADHEAVDQVAIIGVPDEHWGERVHAVVVASGGASPTLAELQAHCRRRIAGFKVPRSLELVDHLPVSGPGKVEKTTLRRRHGELEAGAPRLARGA